MILIALSRALKMIAKPSRMWMRRRSCRNSYSNRLLHGDEAEVEEVPEQVLEAQPVLRDHRRAVRRPGTSAVMLYENVFCSSVCL